MKDVFLKLFSTEDFPPRWQCGNWSEALGWSYIAADISIALAYFGIPVSIAIYLLRQKGEIYFPNLYWLFAAFIFFCGLGHLVDATLFWYPWYRFSGLVNWLTALISWTTLVALVFYLPEAVRLPGALRLSQERQKQIADLERAQVELQERENQFRTLAETVPLVVFTADRSGQVDFINSTYTEVTGRLAAQALGTGWMEAIVPADRPTVMEAWRQAVKADSPFVSECRWKTQGGKERWFLIRAVSTGNVLAHWVGFAADITAQKEDAEQQIKLERSLQERQRLESLGVLAGGVAHDFNNLLTGVLGNAAMAQRELVSDHAAMEYLKQIEEITLRAADLCRQMLAFCGKGQFLLSRIDLSHLIEETTSLIQASISKKVVVRFDLQEGLPSCEGDESQLRQVIMNVVINASDAVGDRSGYITIRTGAVRADRAYLQQCVGATDLEPGDYVFVEVTDTGCGMSPEVESRIFDPFFSTKFTGRGLGLAATLGIIRVHRGGIQVLSEVGTGSTFRILLPARDKAEGAPQPKEERPEIPWAKGKTILLVDDEETLRSILARLLESWGFTCQTATHGREALEVVQAQSQSIDLVLMDLTMPHMDGAEAFRQIRATVPEMPVVLMSGYSEQDAIPRFGGEGPDSFVQKPFQPNQLQAVLVNVLRKRNGPHG